MSNTTETNKVPMGQKIALGVGMLANQMFPAVMGIFMVVLVQDLGFPGWMWGFVFFFPRIFDSITDPIMGFISDNTKSKWGRRRQYVFIGAILMGISFSFLWKLYSFVTYNDMCPRTSSYVHPPIPWTTRDCKFVVFFCILTHLYNGTIE